MTTFKFDSAEVAATPAHEMGVFTLTVPDERADETRAALWTLGFRKVEES